MTLEPNFPKANTHIHLEAALSVNKLAELAHKNGQELPDAYKNGRYTFTELGSFLKNYDELNTLFIRSADDYYALTKDYLQRMAAEGVIYTDLIVSPAHGLISGIAYPELIQAINRAIEEVPDIKATISLTAVRGAPEHEFYGPKNALKWAKEAAKYKDEPWHQKVTSFGIAGYEFSTEDRLADYAEALNTAAEAGLVKRVHVGESIGKGPALVREALDHLDPKIIDHGCEIAADANLMQEVKAKGIFVTSCPKSNVLLIDALKDVKDHPLWALKKCRYQGGTRR